MNDDPKQDHDPDNDDVEREYDPVSDDEHGKRESDKTSAPATMKGSTALESLAALQSMLNSIGPSLIARSGRPLMQFKSRENGTWMFGRNRTVVEDGSLWAFDPRSFMWGYVCFGADKKIVPGGEVLVSVGQPLPDVTTLPDKGFPWMEQRAVNMKCISGIDAGIEVIFKINTYGGIQAVGELIDTVRDRINGGQHDNKVAPIAALKKDSYPHREFGKTYYPVLAIADWMPLGGPTPAPRPPQPSGPDTAAAAEQPRRRRVA